MKLWEKSEIAKVVMKRGVSRTDNDRMAAELMVILRSQVSLFHQEFFGRNGEQL